MKRTSKRRLTLPREAVRILVAADLTQVAGGADDPGIKTFRTACFGVCASNPCV